MAEITLSNAVRNNLLSLQNTADLLGKTQNRLSTGLKVNSALDDPTAFFTASSLNSRAGDLNRLLDSVGNAVQTVRAADNGITAITKLVESAQATARQALQKQGPAATGGTATGTVSFSDDTAATISGSAIAADTAAVATSTVNAGAVVGGDTIGSLGLVDGNTLTVDIGSLSASITIGGAATSGATLGTATTVTQAIAELNSQLTGTNVALTGGNIVITAPNATDDVTIGGTGAAATLGLTTTEPVTSGGTKAAFDNAVAANDTLTFTINGKSDTITFGTADGSNQVSNRGELAARLTALSGAGGNTGATFALNGSNQVQATAAAVSDGSITVTGTGTDALTLVGLSNNQSATTTNAALAAASTNLTVQNGSATAQTLSLSGIDSTSELNTALGALTGVTASVNSAGRVAITSTTATESLTIGAGTGGATVLGLTAATNASTTTNNVDRAALEKSFNNIRTQINDLAGDASFNGVNLLNGDSLTVTFNESGSASLKVTGVTFDSSGLGVKEAATDSFQSNTSLNTTLKDLDTAIGSLRQQASTFGSNLSVVEVRQDFTKNLINTLETGAANLTLADTNQEGANMLALQTRQQLSSVALSLASQADQNVLRLF